MAFNGSGTFVRIYNWATDKINGVAVSASRMDSEMDGIATGLTTCLTKDGQQIATARIPFAAGTSAMAGSVSAAAYAQTNDANTGFYFPSTDEIGLTAGGTAILTATSSVVTIPSGISLKSNTTPYDAFASGTALIFAQTSAPTGWTKGSTHDDKVLRVVTGAASSGGTVAFSTVFATTATSSYTLQTADIPSHTHAGVTNDQNQDHTHTGTTNSDGAHTHTVSGGTTGGTSSLGSLGSNGGGFTALITPSNIVIDSGGAHTHAFTSGGASQGHIHSFTSNATGGGGGHSHSIDLRVKYLDTIVATKN